MICLTPKPSKTFFVYRIQNKEMLFYSKKAFLRKKGEWSIEQKKENEKKTF